ncbi:hypothetical protein VO64_3232 [Pseudomonas synxantha]|uniref:Uncharacterized protein n=1 Tax=Pseudomonas synxantha TaxID=47883 RepID=A0AAU8TMQ7_9PSED|nr:hypothetical protein VO64_3232 [Pseudomonas synxantha]
MGGHVAQEVLRHTSKQIGASQQGLSQREIEHHGSFGMHAFTWGIAAWKRFKATRAKQTKGRAARGVVNEGGD